MAASNAAPESNVLNESNVSRDNPAPARDGAPEIDIDFWTLLVEARIITIG